MSQIPESLRALAEALSPLSHSLAAGLLIRPVADASPAPQDGEALEALCSELSVSLEECVPAMRQAMASLKDCGLDETEELVDDLATAALELVDMARRIWESPFPARAESLRPLLATLAEAPAAQLLRWILEIMHCAIDPWSIMENPETPDTDFALRVPDAPLRQALRDWDRRYPGILPEGLGI